MKTGLLSLSLAMAGAMTATAADVTVNAYPPLLEPQQAAAPKVNRAPLNQTSKKGLKVFGFTGIDYYRSRSFCNYYSNLYELERLNTIATDEEVAQYSVPDLLRMDAGAYNHDDGYYYAYRVKGYSFGIIRDDKWMKVDPKTGEWSHVYDYAATDEKAHAAFPLYDMAYSMYDGEMYGLVQSTTAVKSRLGLIDLKTGLPYDFTELDEYYFAISFDYEGNLYGVRWKYNDAGTVTGTLLDTFDADFKVTSSRELRVNNAAWLGYYQHGLDFDYTTGDLIWSATNTEGNQKMVRINPDTAETELLGNVGINETFLGLYVPYQTADARTAPARAENLSFTIDENGANSVTISWTNPSTLWNRAEMSDLQSVKVYRDSQDGTPIATLDASGKEGQEMTYVDAEASQGIHTYYIVPVNPKGNGISNSIEAFVGKDTPGAVRDVTLETLDEGKSVRIKWNVPTIGDNEGWFDTSSLTYNVTRLPDNKVVAENLKLRTVTDRNIEEAMFYSYVITPVNAQGEGTPYTSDGILAGASVRIPFASAIDNVNEANRFTSFDSYGTRGLYEFAGCNSSYRQGGSALKYNTQQTNNTTVATPPLNVTEGKTYRVVWKFVIGRYGAGMKEYLHHFRVVGGSQLSPSAMTMIEDFDNFRTTRADEAFEIESFFQAPVSGDYYVGLTCASTIDDWTSLQPWIYLLGCEISEVYDNDLAVVSVDTPGFISSTSSNRIRVNVRNMGLNEQSDYTVSVGISRLDGTFLPFASTKNVPVLKSRESADIEVSGFPADAFDVQDLVGRVELAGDQNADNNTSDFYEVHFFAGDAFNYRADEEYSRWVSTWLPLRIYDQYSASQTYYTADMLGLDEEVNKIRGLAWVYNSPVDIKFDNLQIWLAASDRDVFLSNKWDNENNKLVYNGPLSIPAGDNLFMSVTLDEVFELDQYDNLLVTIYATESENTGNQNFPLQFHVWNNANANIDASDGRDHSYYYGSAEPFNFTQNGYRENSIPVLYIAANGKQDSVECLEFNNGLNVRVSGNTVFLPGNAASLEVFDFNGGKLVSLDVEGRNNVSLPLPAGLYIVRVADAAGNLTTVKAFVK